jgi:polyisoprenoid-binding protein YceI
MTTDSDVSSTETGSRANRLATVALLAAAVAGLVGFATRGQWAWLVADDEVGTTGVTAPSLTFDDETERLYRITPDNGSAISYAVEERLAGETKTAVGTTTVVAGDIVVNTDDPAASRISTIHVNLEMLTSDSTLRDKRLRHDYLASTHFPEATFDVTAIAGLPEIIEDGSTQELVITGQLLVKETVNTVTFTGPASLSADTLEADMTTIVNMSDYGIGPINLSGLVHTEDEVELTFELVADRIAADTDQVAVDVTSVRPVSSAPVTNASFSSDVRPILEANCVSCHTIGGPGHSTISLDTAGDASEIAAGIGTVVASRYMPPWPASDLGVAMQHDYSMSDEDIATIVAWANDGGGIDVAPETVLYPESDPYPPLDIDMELLPAEPYVGSLDVKDDYRCQIIDVPDPEGDGTWIKGLQFNPDKDEIVHHSIISSVRASSRQAIEGFDALAPGAGFTCYATVPSMPGIDADRVGGWTPGSQPRMMPEGYAIYLPPGDFLVNQIHYHFDHVNPPDASSIQLDIYSPEEVAALEAAGTPLKRLRSHSYLTPAEGPCTPDESGPLCDRDAVLDSVAERFGPIFADLPDGLIKACGGTLEDYAQLDGTTFRSVCDLSPRHTGQIYQIGPHMHEFGSAYRMTLNPDTPEERILVDIPIWSFEWQLNYLPEEAILLNEDDVIRIECEWDRSIVHMEEPRYIIWSDGTLDEMCFSSIAVMPFDGQLAGASAGL